MSTLIETLGNEAWLRDNEEGIRALLPKTWTHVQNLNPLSLGFKLKLIGIDWRTDDEFAKVMVYLERIGMMLRDGLTVRANNKSIF